MALRTELARAVASEAYERAAALRDQITRLVLAKEHK
jgi:protein-arginine kinase activator protein McsA